MDGWMEGRKEGWMDVPLKKCVLKILGKVKRNFSDTEVSVFWIFFLNI